MKNGVDRRLANIHVATLKIVVDQIEQSLVDNNYIDVSSGKPVCQNEMTALGVLRLVHMAKQGLDSFFSRTTISIPVDSVFDEIDLIDSIKKRTVKPTVSVKNKIVELTFDCNIPIIESIKSPLDPKHDETNFVPTVVVGRPYKIDGGIPLTRFNDPKGLVM